MHSFVIFEQDVEEVLGVLLPDILPAKNTRVSGHTPPAPLRSPDFGVKYVREEHAKHLLNILLKNYEGVHEDWGGTTFCGITLKWDYIRRTCEISMPGYIEAILKRFHHPRPINPELAPHRYVSRSFSTINAQSPHPR